MSSLCSCDEFKTEVITKKQDFEISETLDTEERKESLWESILRESAEKENLYEKWKKEREEFLPDICRSDASDYLNKEIFPLLLPAMEEMLVQAHQWNALRVQKCRFNGLDYLAEILWNRNVRHPERSQVWLDVFGIPAFKYWLKTHPRPIFPKSWLWTKEEAAFRIQRYVRGWLVRKQSDVQEMRQFWQAINHEKAKYQESFEIL